MDGQVVLRQTEWQVEEAVQGRVQVDAERSRVMKAKMIMDGDNVKGFEIQCGVVECLVINKALHLMTLNADAPQADKEVAKNIACGLMVAEQTEPTDVDCGWK